MRALHHLIIEFASHETFDGKNGVLCIDNRLVAGSTPNQPFTIFVDWPPLTGQAVHPRQMESQ